MPGPTAKDPKTRQRRNQKAGAAEIEATRRRAGPVPQLKRHDPKREWDERTRRWWRDAWESPMATRWLKAEVSGLGRLAILIDEYYQHPTTGALAEIRLQEERFGLSPQGRARLEWTFVPPSVEERGRERREPGPRREYADPRDALEVLEGGRA